MQSKSPDFRFIGLILVLMIGSELHAQDASSSPYSRFGIGDIQAAGVNQNLGMGGVNIAVYSNTTLNYSNPAAYARLALTTFDAGINAGFMKLQSTDKTQRTTDASLGYFSMAFPIKHRKSALGFGIVPLSNVGYLIDDPQVNDNGDRELHVYQGKGGLNQLFVSSGFSIFKGMTAGMSASYLFGTITQERRVEFDNSTYLNTRLTDSREQRGFHFNFGLQYTIDSLKISPSDSLTTLRKESIALSDSLRILQNLLRDPDQPSDTIGKASIVISLKEKIKNISFAEKKVRKRNQRGDWSLILGATYSPDALLNANRSLLAETFRYLDPITQDQILVKDTAYSVTGESGDVKLPSGLAFGVSMKKGSQWLISSDIRLQNWSQYRSYGQSDSLANSYRISLGAQFVPDDRNFSGFWKQVQYMAGLHYSNSFLSLRGQQLTEAGVSAGLGIPIRRGMTLIRFMAETGKRGTTDSGLLEERYVRFTFGLTLNDRWFVKQRYD
ncbi:MAG: hypothetical protein ACKOQ6_08865 [Bacteroidota bacterium]